jgi:uncharacterized protein YkwD
MPVAPQTPSAQEQLLLELANRLRMDPGGEADRLLPGSGTAANIRNALDWFGTDPAAFRAQMAGFAAVAPLAWNAALAQAAETHTLAMIAADEQSHQVPGEATLGSRITAAGYTGWSSVSENVYAYSDDPLYAHAGFVIDWGYDDADWSGGTLRRDWQASGDGMQDAAGHRLALLRAATTEAGFAMLAETDPGTAVGPFLVTQNFGTRHAYQPQLLGVVIRDGDGDAFYDIGEGMGGVTVTATGAAGSFSTTTWASGGYQMVLPQGSYTVTFQGGGLTAPVTLAVTMGRANVKLDARADQAGNGDPDRRLAGDGGADTLLGGTGNDTLMGDGFEAAMALPEARLIWRLYQAVFDRAPDTQGQAHWTEGLVTGAETPASIARAFAASREFANTYGTLDDAGFVTLLYQNVLDRAPDAAGLTEWLGRLAAGADRAGVTLGFADSREFSTRSEAQATAFAQGRSPGAWADDVFRLYQATLGRAPDAAGFLDWLGRLGDGAPFLTAVAGFTGSREFANTYGALDDAGFVTLLYQNVLDRAPDAAGLAAWTDRLATGTTRAEVVQGFAQSREFSAATAGAAAAFVRALGPDDELRGGTGSNLLWGGALADSFIFDTTPATHRVMDLETWDRLVFQGFGHDSAAAIRAHLAQSGADVVFADRGVTVVLANTQLAQITDDMLGF